jgi:hypothetical protein
MKKLLVLVGLITSSYGCGKLDSTHTVRAEGRAEIVHIVDIKFEVCDDLPTQDKVECVQTLLEILKEAVKLNTSTEVAP